MPGEAEWRSLAEGPGARRNPYKISTNQLVCLVVATTTCYHLQLFGGPECTGWNAHSAVPVFDTAEAAARHDAGVRRAIGRALGSFRFEAHNGLTADITRYVRSAPLLRQGVGLNSWLLNGDLVGTRTTIKPTPAA